LSKTSGRAQHQRKERPGVMKGNHATPPSVDQNGEKKYLNKTRKKNHTGKRAKEEDQTSNTVHLEKKNGSSQTPRKLGEGQARKFRSVCGIPETEIIGLGDLNTSRKVRGVKLKIEEFEERD